MCIKLSKNVEVVWISVLASAIIGWFVGVGQLVIMGSWDLFYWSLMPMIPIYSALGWGIYGMILGGSGLFTKSSSVDVDEYGKSETVRAA